MVNFVGFLGQSLENDHGFPPNRPSWMGLTRFHSDVAEGFLASDQLNQDSFQDNTPIAFQPQSNFVGFEEGKYSDIFYNRILIEPSFIDLGNLISGQVRVINVFNAYFVSVTLDAILETGTTGLIITGPVPPTVFGPLQEIQYSITIDNDGPPEIDATFLFDFALPTEDRSVRLIGNRVVILPHYFGAPATETLVWLTNIILNRDGSEQRIRLRAAPRQQFAANAFATVDELNRIENIIYGWRDRSWAIPVWSEVRQVTSVVTVSDTIINVSTEYADFRIGELAMIWKGPRFFDVFEILTLTTTTITLSRGVNDDYPLGIVMPVRLGRLLSDPKRSGNGTTGRMQVAFEVTDNLEQTNVTPVQYLGEDVNILDVPLLSGGTMDDSYAKRMIVHDFQTGTPTFSSPWIYTRIKRELRLVLDGAQEVWDFRRWLHRRAGRAIPFYMPTHENNVRLTQTSGTITSPLVAEDDEQQGLGVDRNHLAINTISSGWLFRTIISSGLNGNGDVEITIDSPLNVDYTDILVISYMGLKRLDSDRIEFRWLQNCVAEVVLPIIEYVP